MNRLTNRFTCEAMPDPDRRAFFTHTAMAAAAGVAAAAGLHAVPAKGATAATTPTADQRKYMEEAARLATKSVEKGWGGPFGAVICEDGEIIGRGQNRVLLTGCPVFHAEVTAIIDASGKLNPKGLLGTDYGAGANSGNDPARAELTGSRADAGAHAQGLRYLHQRRAVPDVHERHLLVAHRPRVLRQQPQGHERHRLRRRLPIRGLRQALEPASHPDCEKLRARHHHEVLQSLDG